MTYEIKIEISAESRHPKYHNSYDDEEHIFHPEYVNPERWQINLVAELPANVIESEWRIIHKEGNFESEHQQNELDSPFSRIITPVPSMGEYDIYLTVTENNGRKHTYHREFTLQDLLFVAFGDSYFSSEGNPDEPGIPSKVMGTIGCNMATLTKILMEKVNIEVPMERAPVWQEKKVRRSNKSGVSSAIELLENLEDGRVITFLNFSRSGASIEEGVLNPRDEDDWTELGQLEEATQTIGQRTVDALIMSLGGNDIQFSDRLLDLLREDLPIVGDGGLKGDEDLNRKKEVDEAMRLIEALPEKFNELAEAIVKLNPKHVFLTEYPVAQFDIIDEYGQVTTKSGCGIFDDPTMNIDERDAQAIKDSGQQLNEKLRKIAAKHGWIYIDGIMEGFAGHGLCSQDKYFYSAEESCKNQGNFKGTLHPNEKGIQVYADCITTALKEHFPFD